jgi:hypothetical protein
LGVITANCAILIFILFAPEIHALPAALQSCPCAYRRLSDRQAPTRSPTHHDFLALLSRNLVNNRCSLATPLLPCALTADTRYVVSFSSRKAG